MIRLWLAPLSRWQQESSGNQRSHLLYLAVPLPLKAQGNTCRERQPHGPFQKEKANTWFEQSQTANTECISLENTGDHFVWKSCPTANAWGVFVATKKTPSTLCTHKYIHHIWIFEFFIWKWPYLIFAISFTQASCVVEIFYTKNTWFFIEFASKERK